MSKQGDLIKLVNQAVEDYKKQRDLYLKHCEDIKIIPDQSLLEIIYKGPRPSSIREAILSVISNQNNQVGVKEVINRVVKLGDFHPNAIRNEVTKLHQAGILSRVATGIYTRAMSDHIQYGTKGGEIVIVSN